MSKNIAFDLDGVIIDFYQHIEKALYRAFGVNLPEHEHTSYNFDIPGVSTKQIIDIVNNCLIYNTVDAKPLNNSIEVLRDLFRFTKKPLVFITARTYNSKIPTELWLKKYLQDIPFKLFMTEYNPKNNVIEDENINIFVDDRYKTIHDITKISHLQHSLLFDSPWNRGRHLKSKKIDRIKNLYEIFYYL